MKNLDYNLSPMSWDNTCPCCESKKIKGSPKPKTSSWVYDYVCNSCSSTFEVNYGDKMGGQFDHITIIEDKYIDVPKLTIEHLAAYLPYMTLGISPIGNKFYLSIGFNMRGKGIENRPIETFINYNYKLVLRPLSDLTKEIEHNGEKFLPIERILKERECDAEYEFIEAIEDDWASAESKFEFAPYSIIKKLHSWHFDTQGLIEAGLAVNYNELNK